MEDKNAGYKAAAQEKLDSGQYAGDFERNFLACAAQIGPPPVIGTFTPTHGDIGSDFVRDGSAALRVWTGDGWHPSYAVVPKGQLCQSPVRAARKA